MPSAGRHQVHDVENLILELISKRCLCLTVNEHDQVGELTFSSCSKKKKKNCTFQFSYNYCTKDDQVFIKVVGNLKFVDACLLAH